jgi:hypothetical protein
VNLYPHMISDMLSHGFNRHSRAEIWAANGRSRNGPLTGSQSALAVCLRLWRREDHHRKVCADGKGAKLRMPATGTHWKRQPPARRISLAPVSDLGTNAGTVQQADKLGFRLLWRSRRNRLSGVVWISSLSGMGAGERILRRTYNRSHRAERKLRTIKLPLDHNTGSAAQQATEALRKETAIADFLRFKRRKAAA